MTDQPIFQGQTARVRALVPNYSGQPVTRAEIQQIVVKVFNVTSTVSPGQRLVFEGNVVIEEVIFDSLQLPEDWSKNGEGFNFEDFIPGYLLNVGGAEYIAEYYFHLDPVTPEDPSTPVLLKRSFRTDPLEGMP